MNKDYTTVKILLITVAVLLVIVLALVLVIAFGDRTPSYETVGMEYVPAVEIYTTPEPTPEPEATPEPTPEPAPDEDGFWACEDTVTVKADQLNVRSGPGTDYSALGSVTRGTELERSGYSDEGWTRIVYEGQTAYVSSDYVSEAE